MAYTAKDVGPRLVDGVEVALTEGEAQKVADEWNENEAAHLALLAADGLERKRVAACAAIEAQRLSRMLDAETAPQEVRDYAEALRQGVSGVIPL